MASATCPSLYSCSTYLPLFSIHSSSPVTCNTKIRKLRHCSESPALSKSARQVVFSGDGSWVVGSRKLSRWRVIVKSQISDSNQGWVEEEKEEEEISRSTLIWRALKLPIYSVALVPLTVGSAAAYLQTHMFYARRYFLLSFSAVLIITWLNLSNDAYDFDTGADKNKKESVVNITGSHSGVLRTANLCLVLGFIGLLYGAMQAGDVRVAGLLFCAILCGYVYQCPPFRLSYKGLGEPLCFAAFGPLSTSAFYFSQASKSQTGILLFSSTVLSVSVLVGITTTLILFCSHFHQIDGDRDVGKMSPLVRIGTQRGSEVVRASVVALYSVLCIFAALKALPLTCALFPFLTLPLGKLVIDFVKENHHGKGKDIYGKVLLCTVTCFIWSSTSSWAHHIENRPTLKHNIVVTKLLVAIQLCPKLKTSFCSDFVKTPWHDVI
eukprot:Gb_39246 [translate_table: standard]